MENTFFIAKNREIFYTRPFCEFFVASHTRLFVVVVDVAVCYTARARISVKGLGGRGPFFFFTKVCVTGALIVRNFY